MQNFSFVPTFIWRRGGDPIGHSWRWSAPAGPGCSRPFSGHSSLMLNIWSCSWSCSVLLFKLFQNSLPELRVCSQRWSRRRVGVIGRSLRSRSVSRWFSRQRRLQHSLLPFKQSFHWFFALKKKIVKTRFLSKNLFLFTCSFFRLSSVRELSAEDWSPIILWRFRCNLALELRLNSPSPIPLDPDCLRSWSRFGVWVSNRGFKFLTAAFSGKFWYVEGVWSKLLGFRGDGVGK